MPLMGTGMRGRRHRAPAVRRHRFDPIRASGARPPDAFRESASGYDCSFLSAGPGPALSLRRGGGRGGPCGGPDRHRPDWRDSPKSGQAAVRAPDPRPPAACPGWSGVRRDHRSGRRALQVPRRACGAAGPIGRRPRRRPQPPESRLPTPAGPPAPAAAPRRAGAPRTAPRPAAPRAAGRPHRAGRPARRRSTRRSCGSPARSSRAW